MTSKLSKHEAARQILLKNSSIMTIQDIYREIIIKDLCEFKVPEKEQLNIVRTSIKRRSVNSNHTEIYDHKIFYQYDNTYFGLVEWLQEEELKKYSDNVNEHILLDNEKYNPNADLFDTSLFLEQEWHKWLYKHIAVNGLEALGFGKLRLYDEKKQSHIIGKYNTGEVGEIDLLLRNDTEIIVIELKRKGVDETVGQICRYVGWVETKLKKKTEKVFGIIIAQDIDKKLEYAIKPIKDNIFYQQLKMNISFGKNSK